MVIYCGKPTIERNMSNTANDTGRYSPDDDGSASGDDSAYVSVRIAFAMILVCGLPANCALIVHILRGQRRLGSREPPQLNLFVVVRGTRTG